MVSHQTIIQDNSHYSAVIMGVMAYQITSVYSTVYSGVDQRKHQSSESLAFVRGIHRGPVNSPHKWPVTRKMFPFDDVIMHWYLDNHEISQMAGLHSFNDIIEFMTKIDVTLWYKHSMTKDNKTVCISMVNTALINQEESNWEAPVLKLYRDVNSATIWVEA